MQDVDSGAERADTDMHVDWHAWNAAFICEYAVLCFWHATLIRLSIQVSLKSLAWGSALDLSHSLNSDSLLSYILCFLRLYIPMKFFSCSISIRHWCTQVDRQSPEIPNSSSVSQSDELVISKSPKAKLNKPANKDTWWRQLRMESTQINLDGVKYLDGNTCCVVSQS